MGPKVMDKFTKFIKQFALASSLSVFGAASAQPFQEPLPLRTPTSPTAHNLSVRQASEIIIKANRAADDAIILGIIGITTPPSKLNLGNGSSVDIGITRESCEKVRASQTGAVAIDQYKQAQEVLISAGHLSRKEAERSLELQTSLQATLAQHKPQIDKACSDVGGKNIFPAPSSP